MGKNIFIQIPYSALVRKSLHVCTLWLPVTLPKGAALKKDCRKEGRLLIKGSLGLLSTPSNCGQVLDSQDLIPMIRSACFISTYYWSSHNNLFNEFMKPPDLLCEDSPRAKRFQMKTKLKSNHCFLWQYLFSLWSPAMAAIWELY